MFLKYLRLILFEEYSKYHEKKNSNTQGVCINDTIIKLTPRCPE